MDSSSHPFGHAAVREAAEASEARERNRHLQFLTETFPDGVVYQYTITGDGRRLLTYLGRGAEQIFGERPPELPADVEWLTARIFPADQPGIAEAAEKSRRDLSQFHHDVRITAADGVERWISIRTRPREMADGTIIWDGVMLDVTGRYRTEEAARRQVDFLAALNQTTLELLERRNRTELLQALAARASTLLKSPHAEISLLEGAELVVRAFSQGRDYLDGDRLDRSQPAISWRAIDSRTPVVTARYAEHPDSREVYRSRGIYSAAVFPIVRGADVLGVLGVAREQPGQPYSEDDIREGTMLAQMAALVVHNATIHEEAVVEGDARTTALRESEERFRGVFDQSPVAMGLFSVPEGRIVELNAAALAVFGYSRDEALARTSLELKLWVDTTLRERFLEQLRREEKVSGFEAQMRRRNGEIFTVLHTSRMITISGRPYRLATLQDISARKQLETARDESLALMRATLESTADGILVVNAQGRIETYNRNFAAMWRLGEHQLGTLGEEQILRAILDQLVAPEEFLASVRDLYSRSEADALDVLQCKDGRIFERYSRPQLVERRLVGRVWSFRDITKRRRAESDLRESEERFRVLAEVSPAGIFRSDPDGRCTFVNRRWCEIAGMTPAEALGDGWKHALHPDDREAVARGWEEAVRTGESSAAEFRFLRPDGSVTWLVGQSRTQLHADGTVAGYVGTITDVTSLKRAEEERERIEAQLRQSRKMESLGTLAGGIAHDFNNILNGTFGFVDLARLELPREHPVHEWLDRIAGSSQRARELVRQILTFSRKNEGERVPLRLHHVVSEALRLLRSTLPATIDLEPRIAGDTPPVLADATQIHQVVLNLCTNAAHAMPARGGGIIVTLEAWNVTAGQAATLGELKPGPHVRLSVADDGCGMDAATLEHIYEPFFTTKETGAGTGLGLAVVHGIVKSHEGAIAVRSAVGVGTTFEIYFPTVTAEVPLSSIPGLPATTPRGHGERILVVDDDPVSGFVIEKLVSSLNYQVDRCARPQEALARFSVAPSSYDLVISDLAMPGMNGEELIEHLIRIRATLPIIVVSGYVEDARQRILDKGTARAVLRKPVSREELARAITDNLHDTGKR
jgi:PAS domain S-box-containing protein